jgi:hypothetical protein
MTTWTQVASLDAPTSGVFDFPSLTLTGYSVIQVVCSDIRVTTDGTDVWIRFYVAGSAVTTGYRWGNAWCSSVTSGTDGSDATTAILLCPNDVNENAGNAAEEALSSVVTIDAPLSTTTYKKAKYETVLTNVSGVVLGQHGHGIMENTGAIQGILVMGSSDLVSGKIRVLGMA